MYTDKIIGGLFGWEFNIRPNDPVVPLWLQGSECMQLVNARSGLCLLAAYLKPANIWLPTYLCESIVTSFVTFEGEINYYPVDIALNSVNRNWLDNVKEKDLVVVIDYFGWRADNDLLEQIRVTGAYILEDASQAILTADVGVGVDYCLYSPRKFFPVPDGGVLCAKGRASLPRVTLQQSPNAWWFQAFHAVMLRGEFDKYGGDRKWFELFQSSEAHSPIGMYQMSEFSNRALSTLFDYEAIASVRIRNYQFLANNLGELAFRPNLPLGVVPLGFPVSIPERDRVRQYMFANKIYPAFHWPVPTCVPSSFTDSRRTAKKLMTLPCDQRYEIADMERMATIIKDAIFS